MKTNLGMSIKKADGRPGLATKSIDLPFVPVEGMYYNDGTWKNWVPKITKVTIEPDEATGSIGLDVLLEADPNGDEPTYEIWGWKII